MRTRTVASILVALLLVGSVAACSTSTEGSSDSGTSQDTGSNGTGSLDDLPSDLGGAEDLLDGFLGEGCARAATYYALVGLSGLAAIGGLSQQEVDEYQTTLDDLRDGLPSELSDDIDVVAEAYKAFFEAVGSGGNLLNPSAELEQASEGLDSPEVQAANDNITQWLDDNCNTGN